MNIFRLFKSLERQKADIVAILLDKNHITAWDATLLLSGGSVQVNITASSGAKVYMDKPQPEQPIFTDTEDDLPF